MKTYSVSHAALLAASFSTALLLSAPGLAHADDMKEDIIVTGAKTTGDFGEKSGIPISKMPQSVQVVTAEDIIDRGIASVGDALRAVPSANAGNSRVSSYQSFSLKVRGFLADQMRNGVRQRYYEDVDASALSDVERIEVLKGPSSVLFGQSAVGGIVSIVTKRPQKEFSASAAATFGSDDRKLGTFDVTGPLSDNLYFRLTGEIERSGTFVDYQDQDRENAGFALTYEPSDRVSAHLVTEWVARRSSRYPGLPVIGTIQSNGIREIPVERFLSEPNFSNLDSFAPLVQAWVDFKVNDNWTITPRVSYSGFDSNFQQIRVRGMEPDNVTLNRNGRFGKEDDDYTIAQIDARGSARFLGLDHKILAGVERDNEWSTFYQQQLTNAGQINVLNPVYTFASVSPNLAFDYYGRWGVRGWAYYAQDQIDLTDRWNLILGARYSSFDFVNKILDSTGSTTKDTSETDAFTYQIGTTYKLDENWSVFGGYNTGIDLESTAGSRSRTGEQFEPEESNQIEAGLRYANDRFNGSVSLFQIRKQNALTTDPVDPDYSVQTGEVTVRGIEIEGAWQVNDALSIQGGYAYMDSEITKSNDGDEGAQLGDTPENQANLFVRYQTPIEGLELRGGVNYVGEALLVNASSIVIPDYTIAELGAAYKIGKVRIDATLTNLFDERYYTASGGSLSVLPGDPRAFNVRVGYQF